MMLRKMPLSKMKPTRSVSDGFPHERYALRSRVGLVSRLQSPRRGIAIVLVLGLLAITLAVSYATLRGQGAATQLARNNGRAYDAREAAHSGLVAALRKMSEN